MSLVTDQYYHQSALSPINQSAYLNKSNVCENPPPPPQGVGAGSADDDDFFLEEASSGRAGEVSKELEGTKGRNLDDDNAIWNSSASARGAAKEDEVHAMSSMTVAC